MFKVTSSLVNLGMNSTICQRIKFDSNDKTGKTFRRIRTQTDEAQIYVVAYVEPTNMIYINMQLTSISH